MGVTGYANTNCTSQFPVDNAFSPLSIRPAAQLHMLVSNLPAVDGLLLERPFEKRKPLAGFGAGERALLSITTAIGVYECTRDTRGIIIDPAGGRSRCQSYELYAKRTAFLRSSISASPGDRAC